MAREIDVPTLVEGVLAGDRRVVAQDLLRALSSRLGH